MIHGQLRLGRVAGVEINLHYSWFIIAALVTMSLAAQLTAAAAGWSGVVIWTAAVLTALAFFAAILLHELAHAAVARARGTPVPSITLFALGGMARMSRDAADARSEFWIAIAGPVTSIVLGLAALLLASTLGWTYEVTPDRPGLAMLVWFGFINITLAIFNMLPGFPLDGGRVLRAIIWGWTGNQLRGTRIAAGVGQAVAMGLIFIGILSALRGAGLGGLWLAIIGMFLSGAARAEALQSTIMERLRGLRVADLMTPPAEALAAAPALAHAPHVDIDAPVTEALEEIGRTDASQLRVLDHGRLRGIISREHILRALNARAEAAT